VVTVRRDEKQERGSPGEEGGPHRRGIRPGPASWGCSVLCLLHLVGTAASLTLTWTSAHGMETVHLGLRGAGFLGQGAGKATAWVCGEVTWDSRKSSQGTGFPLPSAHPSEPFPWLWLCCQPQGPEPVFGQFGSALQTKLENYGNFWPLLPYLTRWKSVRSHLYYEVTVAPLTVFGTPLSGCRVLLGFK
jgi:hypothetical protein